jgi:hypothetical protein
MIQQILAEPAWSGRLNAQDLRGITPLVYGHVNPYGSFLLDLHSRLPIDPPRLNTSPLAPRCCAAMTNSPADATLRLASSMLALGPLGWEHINLTGDYQWKGKRPPQGRFRPLRAQKHP